MGRNLVNQENKWNSFHAKHWVMDDTETDHVLPLWLPLWRFQLDRIKTEIRGSFLLHENTFKEWWVPNVLKVHVEESRSYLTTETDCQIEHFLKELRLQNHMSFWILDFWYVPIFSVFLTLNLEVCKHFKVTHLRRIVIKLWWLEGS